MKEIKVKTELKTMLNIIAKFHFFKFNNHISENNYHHHDLKMQSISTEFYHKIKSR